ncbi:MAG: FG-GAP repeat protein [Phycisphaerales bacterium]
MIDIEKNLCALGVVVCAGLGGAVVAQPCVPVEAQIMVADDGGVGDGYGWAVAIDGDWAVVGASKDDARGTDSGSVYVLKYDGLRWDEFVRIVPSTVWSNDDFGDTVAISGDTIVVGTPGDDESGSGAGAAYVFAFDGTAWVQQAMLTPTGPADGDHFGSTVGIDGDRIVIGAMLDDDGGSNAGKAYIYRRDSSAWSLETTLMPSDIAEFDRFGKDVAISGDRVLISCDGDDDLGDSSGSAYVFTRNGNVWTQSAKLVASDGDEFDQFGERLDIDGNTLIVGARYDDAMGTWSGSAYVFEHDGSGWEEVVKLNAFDAVGSQFFGQDVAVDAGRILIGAWGEHDPFNEFNAGTAYAYSRVGGAWQFDRKIIASDQAGWDFFGYCLDISGDQAIIGADGNDDFWWGVDAGSAYMLDMNCQQICQADLNGDGSLDFFDVSQFLNTQPDFNNDGFFNFFDVSAFLGVFGEGCP